MSGVLALLAGICCLFAIQSYRGGWWGFGTAYAVVSLLLAFGSDRLAAS